MILIFWKELAHALEHDFDALADPAFGQGARWSAAVIFRELEAALRIADDPSRHNGTHAARTVSLSFSVPR